jgi:hypothetical protein
VRNVLIAAAAGMVMLFLGIFLLVLGSLTGAGFAIIAAVVAIPAGLGLLGWSVVDRNRKL